MKQVCGILLFAALLCTGAQSAFAQKDVSDSFCPGSIAPLKAIHGLPDQNDAAKVADAARTVLRAYNDCMVRARSDGFVEPNVHYNELRIAQFQIILGNALFRLQDYDGAHAAFTEARTLSTDVVQWVPPSMAYAMTNTEIGTTIGKNTGVTRSLFYTDAVAVQKAADASLARLAPVPAPSP
jgi:hypothetical protein